MQLREIPALPFALDLPSATEWLDRLPVSSIRECSRLLFPVMQALNVYPMDSVFRLHLLELCHPLVIGIARGLQAHCAGQAFPLPPKTRKIGSLASRFHLETAQAYQQLVEAEAFADPAAADGRALALRRALEHLAHCLLRSAQMYELPSSSARSALARLYRYTHDHGLLDTSPAGEPDRTASARVWFAQIALLGLAAPARFPWEDIQRLFDRLMPHACPGEEDSDPDGGRGMAVFCHEPANVHLLVPAWPDSPPLPDLPFFSARDLLQALPPDARAVAQPESDPLGRAWSRLGVRLPCTDRAGGRRVALSVRFKAVMSMLRQVEARRSVQSRRRQSWSDRNDLQLSPLDPGENLEPCPPSFAGRRTLAATVAAAEAEEGKRSIEVVPTELPGFFLLDSGRWPLRAGALVGLNSDDHSVQLGVVRAGQIRDGRFWHSWELLGSRLHPIRVGKAGDLRDGILVYETEEEISLIVGSDKWRREDAVTVHWRGKAQLFRLAKLLEATSDFHQFGLAIVESDAGGG